MDKQKLKVTKREILGRKVKKLRREGILPANVFGKKITSQAVQVDLREFNQIHEKVGETGVVELLLSGKRRPVLIHNVQIDPVTRVPLHADFHQVSLKEKVTAVVPVELVGEAQAVKEKKGALLTLLNELEVEALPGDLPDRIKVDVTQLKEIDEVVKVSQLKVSDKVKIITDENLDVVKVESLVSKEAEELVKEEEAKAEEAKAEAEAKAGEEKEEEKEEVKEKEVKAEKKEETEGKEAKKGTSEQ